jgi:hypothetical protein
MGLKNDLGVAGNRREIGESAKVAELSATFVEFANRSVQADPFALRPSPFAFALRMAIRDES